MEEKTGIDSGTEIQKLMHEKKVLENRVRHLE